MREKRQINRIGQAAQHGTNLYEDSKRWLYQASPVYGSRFLNRTL